MLCFICIVSHLTLHRINIDHQLCDDIRWLYSQLPLTQEELGRQLEVQYCKGTVNKWINKKHDGEKIRVAMKNWARGQLIDAKKRKSPRMRIASLKIMERIKNTIDDCHKRLANWLCWNYKVNTTSILNILQNLVNESNGRLQVILLPSFETSNMVRRGERRIRAKTAREMLIWGHDRFKNRLISKAREFPWCTPIICEESYTSKTCPKCGELNGALNGKKEFSCPQPDCGFTLDRDINGARNILIRYRTLHCNDLLLFGEPNLLEEFEAPVASMNHDMQG